MALKTNDSGGDDGSDDYGAGDDGADNNRENIGQVPGTVFSKSPGARLSLFKFPSKSSVSVFWSVIS